MTRFVDTFITYRILRLLTTPFEETEAYKLGIIDKKGKELKSMNQLNTVAERDAYTLLHRLVFRIKKIIEKVPIENKKVLSFAAALALIKECNDKNYEPLDLEIKFMDSLPNVISEDVDQVKKFLSSNTLKPFRIHYEEAPANNAAATPGIAGFTPETLGVKRKKKVIKRPPVGM